MWQPLELNKDFKYVLDVVEKTTASLFVTGRAGTGKSTLLQLLVRTSAKKIVVLAPTGIAALNVHGQTIHSFFRFPARPLKQTDIKKRRSRKLYENIDVLIIDEISMVRADLFDNINLFLQINRGNPAPFGGVQLVLFGDLFQLPPIVSSEAEKHLFSWYYETPYFFSAKVFQKGFEMETIELYKVYRQKDRQFLRLLDGLRNNIFDTDDLEDLNVAYRPNAEPKDFYITICPRNRQVDAINTRELAKLDTEAFLYKAKVTGNFDPRLFPTEPLLKLKKGAQVMFIKNDPDKRFVNGTIGIIKELSDDKIVVTIEDREGEKNDVALDVASWEILKYVEDKNNPNEISTEVIGEYIQYPLKLAWAVTIHKSQGKTFERVIIDMGNGAFENGQTYVALSRCTSLDGIILRKPLKMNDILVDERVIDFYDRNR